MKKLSPQAIQKISTPAGNPPTGFIYIYAKSDDKLYRKDSSGVETLIEGTGGGSDPLGTVTTINSNTTLSTEQVIRVDANLNSVTLTMPAVTLGKKYIIKVVDTNGGTNSVSVDFATNSTLDGGGASISLLQNDIITVVGIRHDGGGAGGEHWSIVARQYGTNIYQLLSEKNTPNGYIAADQGITSIRNWGQYTGVGANENVRGIFRTNVPPTPSDDESQGYVVNDIWICESSTVGESGVYMLTDPTATSAVWLRIAEQNANKMYVQQAVISNNTYEYIQQVTKPWINASTHLSVEPIRTPDDENEDEEYTITVKNISSEIANTAEVTIKAVGSQARIGGTFNYKLVITN